MLLQKARFFCIKIKSKLLDIIGNKLVREKLFTIRCSLFVFIQ